LFGRLALPSQGGVRVRELAAQRVGACAPGLELTLQVLDF